MQTHKLNQLGSIPFLLMHLGVIIAFFIPFRWELLALCLASYSVRMFGITAGYHRYFSHRSYKMNRFAQAIMALLGATAAQKGPLWWAANHRHHHRYSDQPADLHSPFQKGLWWSHVGWILSDKHDDVLWDQIPDLAKYPELRWINHYYLIPPTLLAVALYAGGGWGAVVWGFVISTVLLWHGTFTINSLSHVFGSVRYSTKDTSKNNFWLALITLGEGWHNNHHCYMSSANQGFYWWELDISYLTLKLLSLTGWVRDLRKAPVRLLEAKFLKPSLHSRTSTLPREGKARYLEHA